MADDRADAMRADDLITLNRSATVARLLSGVVHEVNNALQVIGGTTELLQDLPALSDPVLKGLQRIHAQNTRAAAALSEVMTFSRQKNDARGLVNMREVMSRSVALRAYAISRARLQVTQQAPADGRVSVEGSATLLQQALINLIVNAEQALDGRPGGRIGVEVDRDGDVVRVRVSDDGPGVDASVASMIFEPFVTTRPRDQASGIGLTSARAIAEMHGGTLTCEACEKGACFALRIPAV
jgi:two-component system C4-dicarboxylate transport sensor histidine kinase DctB